MHSFHRTHNTQTTLTRKAREKSEITMKRCDEREGNGTHRAESGKADRSSREWTSTAQAHQDQTRFFFFTNDKKSAKYTINDQNVPEWSRVAQGTICTYEDGRQRRGGDETSSRTNAKIPQGKNKCKLCAPQKKIAEHSSKWHETHESKCAEHAHLQRECGRETLPHKQRQGVTHQTDIFRAPRIFEFSAKSSHRTAEKSGAAPLAPA